MKREDIDIILGYFFWFILSFLFLPFILFRYQKPPQKVLVFVQSKIGDFVCQSPLFREIKKNFPNLHLAVLLLNPYLEQLARNDPHIDEIIFWDEKADFIKKLKLLIKFLKSHYDWSFNLTFQSWLDFLAIYSLIPNRVTLSSLVLPSSFRLFYKISRTREVVYLKGSYSTQVYLSMLKFMGIHSWDISRRIYLSSKDKEFVKTLLKRTGLRTKKYLIGISVSCGNKLKKWSEEKFAQLADKILEGGKAEVVFLGSEEDKVYVSKVISYLRNKAIDLSGLMGLGELASFCKELDLFISVDSGPLYIASAVGTPLIDIAGPVDIKEQFFFSDKVKIVQKKLECVPCSFVADTARSCKLNRRLCLEEITPEDVFLKVKEIYPDIDG